MQERTDEYRVALDLFMRSAIKVTAVFLVVLICWAGYYLYQSPGVEVIDSLDLAQAARHFSLGRGFVTSFIRPLTLGLQGDPLTPPDLNNPPLYVLLLSGLFSLFGTTDAVVAAGSILCTIASAILLFYFVQARFGIRWGLGTFLVFGMNPAVMESAFSGLPVPFVGLLFLGFSLAFFRRKTDSVPATALLGGLAGLLALAEFDFMLFLPLLFGVVLLDTPRKRAVHAGVFTGTALLVLFPWLLRNAIAAGNPLASLRWYDIALFSSRFPANRVFRDLHREAVLSPGLLGVVWYKSLMFSRLMYRYWLTVSYLPLLPLFLASPFIPTREGRWRRLRTMIFFLFLAQLLIIAVGNGDFARVLSFLPVVTLLGVEVFRGALPALALTRRRRRLLFSAAVFLCCFPGVLTPFFGLPDQHYIATIFSVEEAEMIQKGDRLDKIRSLVKDDEIVISDVPWAVAWYANRNALWIPWELEQMKELKGAFPSIRFLHLTPLLFRYPRAENVAGWQQIYRSGMVPDWLEADRGLLLPGEGLLMGDIIFERLDLE